MATWTGLETIILNEVSQTDGERQRSYGITFMWNLKKKKYKWTYLRSRKILTDVGNKLIVTRAGRDK